jgi:hypothetical protein
MPLFKREAKISKVEPVKAEQQPTEQLEARERAITIKEEEVNRKLDALAKQQTGEGVASEAQNWQAPVQSSP